MAKGKGMGGMGGGMGGMQQLMKQAQKMQEDMQRVQEQAEQNTVEATAGGGMVTVVATGNKRLQSIRIQPEAVDPDDIEMLEDLVLAACNEALTLADDMMQEAMSKVTGNQNLGKMF
ncbi:nucleoid-associated protein [Bacteroidia bacterium]|nr:nucleoid-associated protein [Bacteroidia bacterium]